MANVRVIPATAPVVSAQSKASAVKRRVAAYARVSTDSDEQLTSYEAQVDYYTKFIKSREDWEFVTVYTDVDTSYGLFPKSLRVLDSAKKLPVNSRAVCFVMVVPLHPNPAEEDILHNPIPKIFEPRRFLERRGQYWRRYGDFGIRFIIAIVIYGRAK